MTSYTTTNDKRKGSLSAAKGISPEAKRAVRE